MDLSFSLAPVSHDRALAVETPFSVMPKDPSSIRAYGFRGREPKPRAAPLSTLEQTVVALAAFDHRRTVEPAGRFCRFLYDVFGGSPSTKLANDRLEALRRFAVLYHYDGANVDPNERSAFLAAGFDCEAETEVRRLIDSLASC